MLKSFIFSRGIQYAKAVNSALCIANGFSTGRVFTSWTTVGSSRQPPFPPSVYQGVYSNRIVCPVACGEFTDLSLSTVNVSVVSNEKAAASSVASEV